MKTHGECAEELGISTQKIARPDRRRRLRHSKTQRHRSDRALLLFVPCVGYGPGGFRLGYGGGFYDRTLAAQRPKPFTVGLGYTNGWLPDITPEPHDVPLDALLNDNGAVWPV